MTSGVPSLASASQRPGVNVEIDLRLTDGETLSTAVALPDAVGMLALKTLVRTVRTEDRDAAARLRTRVRSLLTETVGPTPG